MSKSRSGEDGEGVAGGQHLEDRVMKEKAGGR
jgi:hypothetical protein